MRPRLAPYALFVASRAFESGADRVESWESGVEHALRAVRSGLFDETDTAIQHPMTIRIGATKWHREGVQFTPLIHIEITITGKTGF